MRGSTAKLIRHFALGYTTVQHERRNREYMIVEVNKKKGSRAVMCLDPRSIYLRMKDAFKHTVSGTERIKMLSELRKALVSLKASPKPVLGETRHTYLGNPVKFSNM